MYLSHSLETDNETSKKQVKNLRALRHPMHRKIHPELVLPVFAQALQTAALRRMPPDNSEDLFSSKTSRPTSANGWRTRSFHLLAVRLLPTICKVKITFCKIVRHSNNTEFRNTITTVARGCSNFSPNNHTDPEYGVSKSAISLVSVDLPQLDGPTTDAI